MRQGVGRKEFAKGAQAASLAQAEYICYYTIR